MRVRHATMSRVDAKKRSVRAQERNEAKRAVRRQQIRGIEPERFVWLDEVGPLAMLLVPPCCRDAIAFGGM